MGSRPPAACSHFDLERSVAVGKRTCETGSEGPVGTVDMRGEEEPRPDAEFVVSARSGSVLLKQTILKADHFPGGMNWELGMWDLGVDLGTSERESVHHVVDFGGLVRECV